MFDCIPNTTYEQIQLNGGVPNGCGTLFGYVFFTSFLLLVSLIFLNLFIAIILQGFEEVNQKEDMFLNEDALNHFKNQWKKLDPNGRGFIPIGKLPSLLFGIGEPLGYDETYDGDVEK